MRTDPDLYLDHAATSFPKAPGVLEAVAEWYRDFGVSASRGDGSAVDTVAERVTATRKSVARLCGTRADRTLFTSGATESLNIAIRSCLPTNRLRVLTTDTEHNAVARTLHAVDARIDRIPAVDGRLDIEAGITRLREAAARGDGYDLFVFSHGSNVSGHVIDAAAWTEAARALEVPTIVDASQTAGTVDISSIEADFVAFSGHKGLLAPPGIGILGVRQGISLSAQRFGGTGGGGDEFHLDRQPSDWPGGFEPGTPNTPAILGLGAALSWRSRTVGPTPATKFVHSFRELLANAGYTVYGQQNSDDSRLPILAASPPAGIEVAEVGMQLAEQNIHVRTGMCCAPWIHRQLGPDPAKSGVLRLSAGPFVNLEAAARAVSSALLRSPG